MFTDDMQLYMHCGGNSTALTIIRLQWKVSSVIDTSNSLVSDKAVKAQQWKEQLLNHPPVSRPEFPGIIDGQEHSCAESSEAEVQAAIRKLKNGKLQSCGITAEMLKASGIHAVQCVTGRVWQTGVIPLDWK